MATNLYAKLIDGIPTTTCAAEEDTDLIAQILADGFKPYDDSAPKPSVEELQAAVTVNSGAVASKLTDLRSPVSKSGVGELQVAIPIESTVVAPAVSGPVCKIPVPSLVEPIPTYRDDGDRIVLEWKVVENSLTKVAAEIARLHSELAASDYQVIKCYEFALAGEEPPYDPTALHSSRQTIRNRITELEALL